LPDFAVPYFRLEITEAERLAVNRVLTSGWLTTGVECLAFEKEFAEAIGGGVEAIAVNSNTSGMHLALEAVGIGPGDEVIVPALTFTATAEVVRYLGAEPRFVDIDPVSLCIDPKLAAKAITPKTRAIMPVHFGGLAADMDAISALARAHDLAIIEDAAHSFPSTYKERNIGTLGSAATVFSFYANKTITTGEGGMIVTKDAAIAKRCRVMRLHGIDRDAFARFTGNSAQWRYDVIAPGFKYNLPDMAAALGREQLKNAELNRQKREVVAKCYTQAFGGLPVELPAFATSDVHSWHLYVLRLRSDSQVTRDMLEEALHARKIGYSMHYIPLHRMTYWRERFGLRDEDFPAASQHGDMALSLPIFAAMRDQEIDAVIDAVTALFGANARERTA
jgi:dTDP-4-amino-4,6-dideoxygalactose transaminase